ncbi:phosphatase PAP2 family protein [Phytohabitans rumicis]|uniref:Phosphoesterase n=2 Tax=Phytohabitans rumicis TaxID=1076125 RepID=A0A6V8LGX8_9ACTN|nr:phosphatase PAP2 family protein [Phytohabitans rumicis]GFJ94121.1 phosphoesterase [Phytohabitans rumicis]
MQRLWKTGPTWDSGIPLQLDVLRANIRYCATVTAARTDEEAKRSFIIDRRHQSYSAIDGLGPLAAAYRAGAKAVTGITSAPDGTPPARISDALPADAPAGSALGAGSQTSALGAVVRLVDTLRGPHASSNPSKLYYQYPRPWRMTADNQVIATGATDALGFPVYDSEVAVAPQLLRQRGTDPADDGGFVSGHTNALYLAALAFAYAVPERFQELLACAADYSHTRIVAGMHSPLDVIGGRTLATALAAAALHDPQYAGLKATARQQILDYFPGDLLAQAHSSTVDTDPYADRAANAAQYTPRLTYILPRCGGGTAMAVPTGAEVLLETRLPYLDAAQRSEVLRTTALPSGYVLLDGPEQWGRLDLFAAADGYGAFDRDVDVTLDAARGGFHAADAWRNAIDGRGGLVKRGTGTLTLTGQNRYRGDTRLVAGGLIAGSPTAFGQGDLDVYAGATLGVTVRRPGHPGLLVGGTLTVNLGSTLDLHLDGDLRAGAVLRVIDAQRLRGRFAAITVRAEGLRAVPIYNGNGLSVRLVTA